MEAVQYDNQGKMMYHPDFHFAHKQRMTEAGLEYLCKYHGVDELRILSFALGKTERTLATKINELMKDGRYEYYKNLDKHW